jgi:cell wall-associated NlpC family hydrolase
VKTKLTSLIVIAMTVAMAITSQARGTNDEEGSLGDKIKHFFVRPTPTPHKHRKKSTPAEKKETPTPSPKASRSPSPRATDSPAHTATVSPLPSATTAPEASATASPEPSATAIPSPSAMTTPEPSVTASPAASSTPDALTSSLLNPKAVRPISPAPRAKHSPSPSPVAKPTPAPNATLSSGEIAGYESYPPEVRKMIDLALSLTSQNLDYKYGSANPANGGMDCSGFIYYVLSKSGMSDVPRDAREQYAWVRKAGNFQAVLAHSDDTFELDALKPGDLLFWSGTYSVDRDPPITHTMIYLGREKATNHRVMVGASDGRTYKGQSRFGVSVFDFKVSRAKATEDNRPGPAFVGYARIPGLPGG